MAMAIRRVDPDTTAAIVTMDAKPRVGTETMETSSGHKEYRDHLGYDDFLFILL